MIRIKTTRQIIKQENYNYNHQINPFYDKIANKYRNKKWIDLDTLIDFLEDEMDSSNDMHIDAFCICLINILKEKPSSYLLRRKTFHPKRRVVKNEKIC